MTITLANNPGGSTLGGTTTATAVDGVATFSGLTLNNVGNGYTWRHPSNALTPTTTDPINVITTPTPTPTSPTPTPTSPTPTPTSPTPTPTSPTPTSTSPTPTPTSPTPTPTSPTSTPTPPPTPKIIAEQISAVYLKHNKKGKPIGKPVEEIVLTFSTAMNPGTIDNAGNYQVAWASTKKVKKKVQTVLHPMAVRLGGLRPDEHRRHPGDVGPEDEVRQGGPGHDRLPGFDPGRRRRLPGRRHGLRDLAAGRRHLAGLMRPAAGGSRPAAACLPAPIRGARPAPVPN